MHVPFTSFLACNHLFQAITAITVPPSWIWWQEHKRLELEWNGTCCSRNGPFHGSFWKFLVNGKRPRSAPISVINYKPLEVYSLFGTSKFFFLWIQLHISVIIDWSEIKNLKGQHTQREIDLPLPSFLLIIYRQCKEVAITWFVHQV